MISNFAIVLILLMLFAAYTINYYKGLYWSIFFLLLMPKNLLIHISYVFPVITIHRFIIVLMIIMWLLSSKVDKSLKNVQFVKLFILLFIALGISSLGSSYFIVSFKQYIQFLVESILFYIVLVTSSQKNDSIVMLIKTVTMSLLIVAILGVFEKYTNFNISDFFVVENIGYEFEKVQRVVSSSEVQGTYLHRILFGIPMGVGIFYSFMLLSSVFEKQSFVKLLFLISLFGAGLYFSMSRGPWLAFILSAMFIVVIDRKEIAKKFLLVFFISLIVFIVKPGTFDTVSRLYNASFDETSARGSNVQWRIQVLEIAFEKVTHSDSIFNFLFGYGQGSHLFLEFPEVETTTGYTREYESWDNQIAIILLEQGWLGVFFLLLLYLKIFKNGLIYFFNKSNVYKDIILLALGSEFFILLMKTNVSFFAPQLTYIEFINIALIGLILQKTVFETKNQ